MWIRKHERDRRKGVDSPIPTQMVSNEEFVPRPQNPEQKQVEHLIGELSADHASRLGLSRRDYMRTSMGLATCFLAANKVYGSYWEVAEAEAFEPAAAAEKYPKGEYFIIDVQAHFTNGYALKFRSDPTVKGMGFNLKDDVESYGSTRRPTSSSFPACPAARFKKARRASRSRDERGAAAFCRRG
jgi:hypothetical protein